MAVDAGPDAYTLFLRARSAVTAARYPDSLDYTIAVTGIDGSQPRSNHYRADSRPADGVLNVAPISAEEEAHPVPVHGFNFALTAEVCGGHCETGVGHVAVPAGHPPPSADLIGVPLLDPTYMFGLRYAALAPGRSDAASTTDLPVIAIVATRTRDYTVVLVDTPALDGTPTYHLRLTPLRKPHEYRLRELWIGTSDYLPRRALVAGDFTIAPLVDVPWTVDFTISEGAPYIAREAAGATLYLSHRRVVRSAAIAFEEVRRSDGSFKDRPLVAPEADANSLVEPL